MAHALTDGPVPLDNIRIELTDYIVDSLRAMPEHHSLVTNWSGMVLAISDCELSSSKTEERVEVAKQRIMVRILARAAHAEIGAVAPEFLQDDVDPELAEIQGLQVSTKNKAKGKGNTHEVLSVALLKALPDLLIKFKTDSHILSSISSLPRFLLPSVLSLPQRKNDFLELVKNLSDIYKHSGNETVLQNIAEDLAFLVRGDHVRAQDAQVQLQTLAIALSKKLIDLLEETEEPITKPMSKTKKRKSKGKDADDSEDEEEVSTPQDKELAISMCLRRLRILVKRLDLSLLLDDSEDREAMGKLCDAIVDGISTRLEARQIIIPDESEDSDITIPEIWKDGGSELHAAFSDSVTNALQFLRASLAWALREAKENDPICSADDDDAIDEEAEAADIDDHPIAQQRDQLVDFICLCFEQFLPETDDENEDLYTPDQIEFTDVVQTAAFQSAADLRALLPKEWTEAASPLLRACSLSDDKTLIGGSIRYFRSREHQLRDVEEQDSEDLDRVCDLLLPFCRTFVANWSNSNRREAGYAMAHIVGSGRASQQMLTSMSRIVKKMDPVHLLETHMACLRTSFDDWLNSEPEDLESDRPTDEEMAEFEEAEKAHHERFDLIVQQAGRLSQSLGVGKVDAQLEKPLLGFCREGIRYAFSTDMTNGEEPLLPGGRLTFLALLGKYVSWIRRSSSFGDVVVHNVEEREEDLQDDPDYDQAHQDDLSALAAFRKTIGLKAADAGTPAKSPRSVASHSQVSEGDESDVDSGKSPATTDAFKNKRPRLSRGSSVGSSIRSISGNLSFLSPLMEEDDDSADDESPHEVKKRKLGKARRSSVGSALSGTIQEEDSDGEDLSPLMEAGDEDEPSVLGKSGTIQEEDSSEDESPVKKRKLGKARRSSVRSALSGTIQEEDSDGEDLSPLMEAGDEDEPSVLGKSGTIQEEDSSEDESPVKKRKLGKARRSSVRSALSGTIQEEDSYASSE